MAAAERSVGVGIVGKENNKTTQSFDILSHKHVGQPRSHHPTDPHALCVIRYVVWLGATDAFPAALCL